MEVNGKSKNTRSVLLRRNDSGYTSTRPWYFPTCIPSPTDKSDTLIASSGSLLFLANESSISIMYPYAEHATLRILDALFNPLTGCQDTQDFLEITIHNLVPDI